MTTKAEIIAAHRAHPDWTCAEIARQLGCSRGHVSRIANSVGFVLTKWQRNPEARHVPVPAWVPDNLRPEYVRVALLFGEEDAASHVRDLKRSVAA